MNAYTLVRQSEVYLASTFSYIDAVASYNTSKILHAFEHHEVSERHLSYSTGYGYNDDGRDTLDAVFAEVFDAEAAFVRPHIVSGTHAITIGLFGLLRPGDTLLSVTGMPYDTLKGTIFGKGQGSLADFGIKYRDVEMANSEKSPFDLAAIESILREDDSVKVVYAQKSKGYSLRPSLQSHDFEQLVRLVKSIRREVYVVVDNCYGEFTEYREPPNYGVDLVIGSLIKNPGGGIAESGGYIAGTKKAVELASYRLTTPGIGAEVGASLGATRNIFKGLSIAAHVTAQSLKTAALFACAYDALGYEVSPKHNDYRSDIVQTITFGDPDKLIRFVQAVQSASFIDSQVKPVPSPMPGYDCDIIMASGSFTLGSSIEISADAPLREPYAVYVQGATTYEAGRCCVEKTLENEVFDED
ncbi:hypothetical protein FACS1894219_08560 [Clostridia bacterium]|nr:hypothetical protein FACS1894219_08560 [Clostridia bacterium]